MRPEKKKLTEPQLMALGAGALFYMRKSWFETITPSLDRPTALLLMAVYYFNLVGQPLSKKVAWAQMDLEDIKTSRKHISFAEAQGFIEVVRSQEDRRKELLLPTTKLKRLVEQVVSEFAADIEFLTKIAADAKHAGLQYLLKTHARAMDVQEPQSIWDNLKGAAYVMQRIASQNKPAKNSTQKNKS